MKCIDFPLFHCFGRPLGCCYLKWVGCLKRSGCADKVIKASGGFSAMNTAVNGECQTQLYVDVSLFLHDDISDPVLAEISAEGSYHALGASRTLRCTS